VYLYEDSPDDAPPPPPSPSSYDSPTGGTPKNLLRAASISGRPHSPSFDGSASDVVSEYSFIRKRTSGGTSSYGVTTVQTHKNGQKIEIKRIITGRE
jgi:hypothetical protein